MNRRIISSQVLLYFLMMMFMMLIGCSSGSSSNGTPAPPPAFTQADLTGTWHAHMLQAGSTNEWQYVTVTVDSTGTLSFADCLDSTTSTSCPADKIKWTINASGVISETDNGTGTDSHYTMTSNKNLIAGTSTGGGTDPQLLIAQKVVTGTTYSSTDLKSKSIVYHLLNAGTYNMWEYATGTIDGTGTINISSETTPYGTDTPEGVGTTISVDANGVVTMTENDFHGFLSDDKKTIVGTSTNGDGDYALWIFNITNGQSNTVGALPAGTLYGHELACGKSPAPWWNHETVTVASGGGITLGDFVSSSSLVTVPAGAFTGSITDTSGTVAISGMSTYHGQMSYDGKFVVGTRTNDTGIYSLSLMTK